MDDIVELDSPMEQPADFIDEDSSAPTPPRDTQPEDASPNNNDPDTSNSTNNSTNPTSSQSQKQDDKNKDSKSKDPPRKTLLEYPNSLGYECESLEEMDEKLEFIVRRIVDCVRSRDFDVGFVQWNHKLECWLAMKYPMKRQTRAKLAKLYYELSVLPGMDARLIDVAANQCMALLEPKKRIDRGDLTLPWRPLYNVLEKELFPKARKTGQTNISGTLLNLCEYSQRFFSPHSVPYLLETLLPRLDGSSLNSIIATQAFLCHFLPLSHPQYYLNMVFRLWEGFKSSIWDDQWLDLVARLIERHCGVEGGDGGLSWDGGVRFEREKRKWEKMEEKEKEKIRRKREGGDENLQVDDIVMDDDDVDDGEVEDTEEEKERRRNWKGPRKDVGIFTDAQWNFIMTKCLRSMGIPVGSSKSGGISASTNEGAADTRATTTTLTMKKPSEKLHSYAILIVYSMARDAPISTGGTGVNSPAMTPVPSQASSSTNLVAVAAAEEAFSNNGLQPPPEGTGVNKKPRTYLAGSKALDGLAKIVQATESFYHPSNYGSWTMVLVRFLQNVSWEFLKRWKEEEKPECKTPLEYRLTPEIKRHFVLTMRTVALLSMFSKDPVTIAAAQAALKSMSLLEPQLIIPAVLERAYPALENLIEVNRTTACINTLSNISNPMISRTVYPGGAKHVLPLLELCLPGLDVNDPLKTMSSALFILQAVSNLRIDDLTHLPSDESDTGGNMLIDGGASIGGSSVAMNGINSQTSTPALEIEGELLSEDGTPQLSRAEEDAAIKNSTAGFPDWVAKFFRQCLTLFENLPEPGKNNKSGGKSEEQMLTTLIAACEIVCGQLSPDLFDLALGIFYDHCATTVRANSVKAVGHLTGCFARVDPEKVLARFFPLCRKKIEEELHHGAASVRTTSTASYVDSDIALSWYCGLLVASCTHGGTQLLAHKTELINLMKLMAEKCKSERAYAYNGRFVSMVLSSLTSMWPKDYRFVNPDEWNSPEFARTHYRQWGKLYQAKEVKIDWHVSSDPEIELTLEILNQVIEPAVSTLETLTSESQVDTKPKGEVWSNDFCRHLTVVRSAFSALSSLISIDKPKRPGKDTTDMGMVDREFVDYSPVANAGVCLTDPKDPRHQKVSALRERACQMLHTAVGALKSHGAEDSIDCIKLLISSCKAFLLDYPCDRFVHGQLKKSFEFARNLTRTTKGQKYFPRLVWVRRAAFYHASRQRICSFYRKRGALDDQIIFDMCELSLSPYLRARTAAQKALDSFTSYYDGTRTLVLDTLFNALKPGNDHDRMKGALFVLGSKMFGNLCIIDWRYGPRYIMSLLNCQHQERPSVQNLVKGVTHDYIVRLSEPSTLKAFLHSEGLHQAADELENETPLEEDRELIQRVSKICRERVDQKNEAYDALIPQLLSLAKAPTTHWRYVLQATRVLRALIRRDRAIKPEVLAYMTECMISDLPNLRTHSLLGVIKLLHFVKLRTLCEGSDERLLLMQARNPLKRTISLPSPIPSDFTERFVEDFKTSIADNHRGKEVHLVDKQNTGWLVWGDEVQVYDVPPDTGSVFTWDLPSEPALEQMRQIMKPSWWSRLGDILAQEHTRDYLASDNVTLIKSIFQIFEDGPLDMILPVIEKFLEDDDRHKQRAAGELIGGIMRGSKHWSLDKSKRVWKWFTPRISKMFQKMTPDTQNAWEMMVEYILGNRDPRRNAPLVEFITALKLDPESSEAFNQAKAQYLVGTTMKSLSWHFLPWADQYSELYWSSVANPYTEIRAAVADNLLHLTQLRIHPSFISIEELLHDCEIDRAHSRLVGAHDPGTTKRLSDLQTSLVSWRENRKPASTGSQTYDNAAMTLLTWLWDGLHDFRVQALFPLVIRLLPELFRMQEIQDNVELENLAKNVLAAISTLEWPEDLVPQLMNTLVDILKTSTSWRVRLDVLPVFQVFYFHSLYMIDESSVKQIMELLCGDVLRDSHIEVREQAATTLSGIVRCSQRSAILMLRDRFSKILKTSKLPRRRRNTNGEELPGYQDALLRLHSGILGAAALIDAFPYEVPPWMPALLLQMGKFVSSPAPISTTIKRSLADFKKSHQDSWQEDRKAFTEEQQMELNDLLVGSTYYA